MAATDVVAYTFNADNYHPSCVLIAWGYSQRTAETLVVEDELDALAEDRSINRMDEHSFDSDHFPKVIFESDRESCDEDGRPYSCGTCGQNLDPDYVAPFHWHVGSNAPGSEPEGGVSCHDNPDAAREVFIAALKAAAETLPTCKHGTSKMPRTEECDGCSPYYAVLREAELLENNPHRIAHDTVLHEFDGDARRPLPAVHWVKRVPSHECEIPAA